MGITVKGVIKIWFRDICVISSGEKSITIILSRLLVSFVSIR